LTVLASENTHIDNGLISHLLLVLKMQNDLLMIMQLWRFRFRRQLFFYH